MIRLLPLALFAASATADVVIRMPAVPASAVAPAASASKAPAVRPLQRFAIGEPAKDRAGNVILYTLPPTVTSNGGGSGWGNYGVGYNWGGYGWGGYGWGGWGWGSPIILSPCCTPCDVPYPPVWRGSSVVFEVGL